MSEIRSAANYPESGQALAARLVAWFGESEFQDSLFAVALSGGVDSAVVSKAAYLSGRSCVAVTSDSPSVAQREIEDAREVARMVGIEHRVLQTRELDDPDYRANDGRRCYHCKTNLFRSIALAYPGAIILTGTNKDDLGDYRPGLLAARESGVRAPLAELGIDKQMLRGLAEAWGLPVASKPASPCLSSRLAYGVEVTAERLARVEQAEALLRKMGLRDCRVRLHADELARIEVSEEAIVSLTLRDHRESLVAALKQLGFRYVTLDLEGFRSGSLNEVFQIQSVRS